MAAPAGASSIRFGAFRLDLAGSRLLRGDTPIHLTPKAFALLRLLASRPGELVTKAEAFAAVWPGVSVSDDALTRCVRELRAALGDDARAARVVKTEHRRGFRFVARASAQWVDSAAEALPLIGRVAELAAARDWLGARSDGRVKLLAIRGEPGAGKTRLARAIASLAEARGARVLWTRTPSDEGAAPYATWREVLSAGAGAPDAAAAAPIEPLDGRQRFFSSAVRALSALTARSPLLLVLDDLHAADPDSLTLLDRLLQDVDDPRLSLLCTLRDVGARANPRLSEVLAAAAGPGRADLFVGGLAPQDVRALLEARLGAPCDAALAEIAHEKSGGNPLYLIEPAELLPSARKLAPEASRIPDRVRSLVERRIGVVSARCAEVLAAAAVIGGAAGPDELGAVVDLSPAALAEGLAEAARERLLERDGGAAGRWRFRHGLVREVAYERASPGVRARLHRRHARALERAGGEESLARLSALAHHFGRSLIGGGTAEAIAYALRAGERALAEYAFEQAATHYGAALDALEAAEPGDPACAAHAAARAARAHALCGRGELALTLAGRALEAARRSGSASAFREAVEAYCDLQPSYGRDQSAEALLREAFDATGEDEPAARSRLLALRGMLAYVDADLARHEAASREALALARRAGDRDALLEALRVRSFGLNHPATEREWRACCDERIAAAAAAGSAIHEFHARTQRFDLRLQVADVAGAAEELRALEELAARARSPKMEATLLGIRAGLAIAGGPPAEARRLAERAFALGRQIDPSEWWATAQLQLGAVLRLEDRVVEAIPAVQRGRSSHAQVSLFHAGEIWIQALTGRENEARARLRELAASRFAALQANVSYAATVANLSLSCERLRCEEAAEGLRERLLPYAGRNITVLCWYSAGSAHRYLALVETCLGAWERASAHFEAALAAERASGARVWEAHVRLDYARMLLAQGGAERARAARALASDALATSEQLAIPHTARLARELHAAA